MLPPIGEVLGFIPDHPHCNKVNPSPIYVNGLSHDFQHATREIVKFAPLPCWKHHTPEQRQNQAVALVAGIEDEAAAYRPTSYRPGPPRKSSFSSD